MTAVTRGTNGNEPNIPKPPSVPIPRPTKAVTDPDSMPVPGGPNDPMTPHPKAETCGRQIKADPRSTVGECGHFLPHLLAGGHSTCHLAAGHSGHHSDGVATWTRVAS